MESPPPTPHSPALPTASKPANPAPSAAFFSTGCAYTREPPSLLVSGLSAVAAGDGASSEQPPLQMTPATMVLGRFSVGCPGEGDFALAGDGAPPTAPLLSTEDGASRATTAVPGAPAPHLPQPPATATAPPHALQGEEAGVDGRGAAAWPTAPPVGSAPPPATKPAPLAQPSGADGAESGATRPDDRGAAVVAITRWPGCGHLGRSRGGRAAANIACGAHSFLYRADGATHAPSAAGSGHH